MQRYETKAHIPQQVKWIAESGHPPFQALLRQTEHWFNYAIHPIDGIPFPDQQFHQRRVCFMIKLLFRTLGIVLFCISLMALGACISQSQRPSIAQSDTYANSDKSGTPQVQSVLPQIQSQRYVLVMHPQYRGDQYLVDTQAGRIWQKVVATDYVGEPTFWEPMERPESTYDEYQMLKKFKKVKAKPTPPAVKVPETNSDQP